MVLEAGGAYLEAPVSGSKGPAEQGTLIFLCGGDEALFERSAALLDVMGKAKLFLGQVISWFPLRAPKSMAGHCGGAVSGSEN